MHQVRARSGRDARFACAGGSPGIPALEPVWRRVVQDSARSSGKNSGRGGLVGVAVGVTVGVRVGLGVAVGGLVGDGSGVWVGVGSAQGPATVTVIGCMAAMWVPRGKHKGLVLGLMSALAGLGALLVVAGIAAVVSSQPYHVWYPLVLCGAILGLVCGINLPIIAMRYRQAEMRRMDAESLRRS